MSQKWANEGQRVIFGDELRKAREKQGWNQKKLADQLNAVLNPPQKFTQTSVSRMERGLKKTYPQSDLLDALERLLTLSDKAIVAVRRESEELARCKMINVQQAWLFAY